MFGILLPSSLGLAAQDSEKVVRDLVPRILETEIRMREVEIGVRRGRKEVAKAERRGAGEMK
jgi:hypothetical protein